MSYRWLWCLGVAVPLGCGHTSSSQPSAGQGGKSTGADSATVAGGRAAVGGKNGTGTAGVDRTSAGAGGTPTDPLEPSTGGVADGGASGSEAGGGGQPLPLERASCQALSAPCGQAETSCCEAPEISGATFARYDGNQAKVSDFRLDKFEVTVGRFRAFIEHYPSDVPAPHSGKNSRDAQDTGWDPSWNVQLLPSATALTAALACSPDLATWSDAPADNENRPINCLTWYEAQAFCIWDGGRLPSDLEWEYAARGGAEARRVPWGSVQEPSARAFANYRNYCETDPQMLTPPCMGIAQIWLVGSAPGGDGRFGQSDLAGNLWEYTLDYFGPALDCTDCARHVPTPPGTGQYAMHVSRGGAYAYDLGDGLWNRDDYYPTEPRFAALGFRCAFDAKPN